MRNDHCALTLVPSNNPNSVANVKSIGATNLKRWKKEFDKKPSDFGKDLRREVNGRKVKHPELDEHLKAWFVKLREAKIAVSSVMMLKEAEKFIELKNIKDLKLSNGWLWKLLKRLKIVKRKATKVAQKSASSFTFEIEKNISLITELR